jgi:hypothetical protein
VGRDGGGSVIVRESREYPFDASTATHYSRRRARAALHVQGCRRSGDPTCGGGFTCGRCGKLVGWCRGGTSGDVTDAWCEVCANKHYAQKSGDTKRLVPEDK